MSWSLVWLATLGMSCRMCWHGLYWVLKPCGTHSCMFTMLCLPPTVPPQVTSSRRQMHCLPWCQFARKQSSQLRCWRICQKRQQSAPLRRGGTSHAPRRGSQLIGRQCCGSTSRRAQTRLLCVGQTMWASLHFSGGWRSLAMLWTSARRSLLLRLG